MRRLALTVILLSIAALCLAGTPQGPGGSIPFYQRCAGRCSWQTGILKGGSWLGYTVDYSCGIDGVCQCLGHCEEQYPCSVQLEVTFFFPTDCPPEGVTVTTPGEYFLSVSESVCGETATASLHWPDGCYGVGDGYGNPDGLAKIEALCTDCASGHCGQ